MLPAYGSLAPLVPWQTSARPMEWARCFGREAPLVLEIGFGNGEFLAREAARHPERDFLGIERRWVRVRSALRKLAFARVPNVRLLHAPAEVALDWLFAPRTLASAYALFPCPWPRRRNIHERLFGRRFVRTLNNRLVDGGTVEIVTDHLPYMDWIRGEVAGSGFESRVEAVAPRYETKYERRWTARGQGIFQRIALRKVAHDEVKPTEESDLKTHRVERFDPDRFAPEGARGECALEFRDFLFDARRRRGMVRVVVAEDDLTQDFWIEIAAREGDWHIRPARGSWVLPTRGAAHALDRVRAAAAATGRSAPAREEGASP